MSGNVDRDVAEVKKYLGSQYMNTVDEWLTGCVEYLYNNSSGKQYSINEIKMLTRGQWLLNDLTIICPGCLPPGLNQTARTVLNGKFVLQINYLLDIGCPAYQQLQQLKKINEENIEATVQREDKVASHRMVKMDLTDGVQDITAIEYRPMRNITCELPPGTKILIKGPVKCSIGTLLLEEKNVEVLGGEVDSLVENNTTLQILNRIVYEQSEGPITNSSLQSGPLSLTNPPRPMTNTSLQSGPLSLTNPFRNNFVIEVPPNTINCNSKTNTAPARPLKNEATIDRGAIRQVDNFQEDDMNIDIEQLAAIEQRALAAVSAGTEQNTTRAKHAIQLRSPDSYKNMSNANKKIKIDANSLFHSINQKNINDYPVDEIDLTSNEDLEAQLLAEMDAKLAQTTSNMPITLWDSPVAVQANVTVKCNANINHPMKVTSAPFCYIKQINNIVDNNQGKGRKFIIKAQIQKVLSKLLIVKECWSLRCTLIDGSGKLDADFTSDTLTKLVGYSPMEMGKMKKLFQSNPDLKLKAVVALKSAKEKLQILNCLVEISIADTPKITQLIEYTEGHLLLLKQRSIDNL